MRPLLVALAASICISVPALAEEQSQNVIVAPATMDRFVDRIEALGTTYSNESVIIAANVTDKVTQIMFEDGQRVEKGDLLVAMRRDEQRAALAAAEAVLAERKTSYERARALESRQYTTTAQLQERQAALFEAEALRDAAKARLDDREIRAPFNGIVGLRSISIGALVTPGERITTLDDLDTIKLDFTVPAVYLTELRPGLAITGRTTALPGREFRGEMSSVSSRVDPATRSVTARALIDNKDHALRPGLLMTLQLMTNPRMVIVIPEEALVPSGVDNFAFVVDDNKAERRQVKIGARRPGEVEILAGLAEGDLVVTHGTMRLRDGQKVKVIEEQRQGHAIGHLSDGITAIQ
jgi:membrane fusion protein (multidrug efflux system)